MGIVFAGIVMRLIFRFDLNECFLCGQDLNKDGKITKADILKGRGVIAKKGMSVKKCKNGCKK